MPFVASFALLGPRSLAAQYLPTQKVHLCLQLHFNPSWHQLAPHWLRWCSGRANRFSSVAGSWPVGLRGFLGPCGHRLLPLVPSLEFCVAKAPPFLLTGFSGW